MSSMFAYQMVNGMDFYEAILTFKLQILEIIFASSAQLSIYRRMDLLLKAVLNSLNPAFTIIFQSPYFVCFPESSVGEHQVFNE